ncbi:MAG: hypothetical protein ACLP0J_29630 [Solirubrobacteraceae bacterium]|jgi:hypothetical protein
MINTSSHTNATTDRRAKVGPEALPVYTPAHEREQAMVRTRIGSFADGMTARSDSAERTVGSFATGMATHPERSRARTGSFADGLTAVSDRVRARIGSFADVTAPRGLGDRVKLGANFAPGVSPASHGSEHAACSASSVAQDALAA